ncbi:ABC transporter permease [Bauldia litoralis]|uniref:Ribose transport system permease protein n=1 Tax=Bauldia litoralis TaxID=665467 RepID=A0A1G6A866_9HYPH|nr:ABC transporter permease [Bauldia litoralis]SDB04496.1 ribose transport system permease protein [Bauldia litoralis]
MKPGILTTLRPYFLPALVLAVTWLVIASITPTFRGAASIFSVLEGFSLVGLVALGLAATIIAGEFDLSVGSMAAVAAVIAVLCEGAGLVGAVLIATLAGAALGAIQGTLIGRLGINSLVFTIGTLIFLRGITYILSDSAPIMIDAYEITDPLLERYGIFSLSSLTALVMFAIVGLFLTYTRWGREIFAIGGARNEAIAAGVPVVRPMAIAFALSAGCASLAGALAAMRGGSAAPQNYEDLLLSGAAAALLGGISLYGGRGTVFNVALGVAVLSVVGAGLAARGSTASLVQLVTGVLLLTVITIEFLAGRLRLEDTVFAGLTGRRARGSAGAGS